MTARHAVQLVAGADRLGGDLAGAPALLEGPHDAFTASTSPCCCVRTGTPDDSRLFV